MKFSILYFVQEFVGLVSERERERQREREREFRDVSVYIPEAGANALYFETHVTYVTYIKIIITIIIRRFIFKIKRFFRYGFDIDLLYVQVNSF